MSASVPTITQVVPGAGASIILKQDQASGRQVQGVVSEVLTRGNHPRGIKVRLRDGRIGRVQRMVAATVAAAAAAADAEASAPWSASLQADLQAQAVARAEEGGGGGGGGSSSSRPQGRQYRSDRIGMRYSDARNDDGGEEPPSEMDLMAYVKPAKTRKKGKGKKSGGGGGGVGEAGEAGAEREDGGEAGRDAVVLDQASCPVCGEFEGDEAAVRHHVESHFR